MNIFKKKIPVAYTVVFAVVLSGVSIFLSQKFSTSAALAKQGANNTATADCKNYNVARLKGYTYVSPLVSQEPECESPRLAALKQDITGLIESEKQGGLITSASVFIKEMSSDDWTCVNPDETFMPGSLFKLPVLITILRMAENDPGFLNKKIVCDPKVLVNIPQTYTSKSVQAGKSYTIKELLTYMIVYSDNGATQLLNQNMNTDILIKVFTDLGLQAPKADPRSYLTYKIHTREYSIFMEALYNGSYLTINQSEYATSLLAQCNFTEGLVKGLPANVKIAHKFGEAGIGDAHELHETGIIYMNNDAYIVTVMTRGNDLKKLPLTISEISAKVYAFMTRHS